jgi:hypothetical protein
MSGKIYVTMAKVELEGCDNVYVGIDKDIACDINEIIRREKNNTLPTIRSINGYISLHLDVWENGKLIRSYGNDKFEKDTWYDYDDQDDLKYTEVI